MTGERALHHFLVAGAPLVDDGVQQVRTRSSCMLEYPKGAGGGQGNSYIMGEGGGLPKEVGEILKRQFLKFFKNFSPFFGIFLPKIAIKY